VLASWILTQQRTRSSSQRHGSRLEALRSVDLEGAARAMSWLFGRSAPAGQGQGGGGQAGDRPGLASVQKLKGYYDLAKVRAKGRVACHPAAAAAAAASRAPGAAAAPPPSAPPPHPNPKRARAGGAGARIRG
jgi:hypothetical protein